MTGKDLRIIDIKAITVPVKYSPNSCSNFIVLSNDNRACSSVMRLFISLERRNYYAHDLENNYYPDGAQHLNPNCLIDILMVFLKEFFEKVDFEKKQKTKKAYKNYPACFDSLRPINNLSVIKGQVFLG